MIANELIEAKKVAVDIAGDKISIVAVFYY